MKRLVVLLCGLLTGLPSVAFGIQLLGDFQKVPKKLTKSLVLSDCPVVEGFDSISFSNRGRSAALPSSAKRGPASVTPKNLKYFACGIADDSLYSVFAKSDLASEEIVELRFTIDDFPKVSIDAFCKKVKPLGKSVTYKDRGSNHFPTPAQRNSISIIGYGGSPDFKTSCIKVRASNGKIVGRAGVYDKNSFGYNFRAYGWVGCGDRKHGDTIAAKAKKLTGSTNVYFDVGGGVCIGPQPAEKCTNSIQC